MRIFLLILLLPGFFFGQTKVAFLADLHFEDVYAQWQGTPYKGIRNPVDGQFVHIRTMAAQLESTRIFNENYFAFLAALDNIAKKGIQIVALPGDYSDDGQPANIRGLGKILERYSAQYGIRFFITTGNHDPVRPWDMEGGKADFMGEGGQNQAVFSTQKGYQSKPSDFPTILTPDLAHLGYEGILSALAPFGFSPDKRDLFWATPFSDYAYESYDFGKAEKAGRIENRTYEVLPGFTLPDASYVVEPREGLWLLALDGNTYVPKANGKANDPLSYSGASVGYNNTILYKKHLIAWVVKLSAEAKRLGKTLIAFSHYPMVDYFDGASAEITAVFGTDKWQHDRIPTELVGTAFADAGLKLHFAGHLHLNDTGRFTTAKGNTLVNVQTPSLAAYLPAYKLLELKDTQAEVQTVKIENVPNFQSFFDLYRMEYALLKEQNKPSIWNPDILKSNSYGDFTRNHLRELVRLRFLNHDWPENLKNELIEMDGAALLKKVSCRKIEIDPKDFQWHGMDLIQDFYRMNSADELARADIGSKRLTAYQVLIDVSAECKNTQFDNAVTTKLRQFLIAFGKFLHSEPADHFTIDLKTGVLVRK